MKNHNLTAYSETILRQLSSLVGILSMNEYRQALPGLTGASIGQHVRHIIEFYQCLLQANKTGELDYDKRDRNKMIEENPDYANLCIYTIIEDLHLIPLKKSVLLHVCYEKNDISFPVDTTIERELIYNIEHTVHHMAIIKIGLKELKPHYVLPTDFGVAISTLKHQENVHRHVLTQK